MPASLDFSHRDPASPCHERHNDAVAHPLGFERSILNMLNAIAEYAQSYERRWGRFVGDDAIAGDDGLSPILEGIKTMLRSDAGRLDAGTIHQVIHDLANRYKVFLRA